MEKKRKKMSLNSTIYILIGVMLACILLVTGLTAALRRQKPAKTETAADSTALGEAESKGSNGGKVGKTETTAPVITEKESKTDKTASAIKDKPSEEKPAAAAIRYYALPVEGAVTKHFEIDVPVYSTTMNDYRAHTGVDFLAEKGSAVQAVEYGTVCKIWNDPMMGRCVSIDHGDEIISTYMNLSEQLASDIEVGCKVKQGQSIGTVGETSLVEIAEEPHLHFEMKVGGQLVDPIEYMGVDGVYAQYEG